MDEDGYVEDLLEVILGACRGFAGRVEKGT